MKNLTRILLFILLAFATVHTKAATVPANSVATENMSDTQKKARLEQIETRVQEIYFMDKSQLTKEQRHELKTELKGLKKETKSLGNRTILLPIMSVLILVFVLVVLL